MKHPPLAGALRRVATLALLACPIAGAAVACDRIGYYSNTGSAAAGGDDGPGAGPSNGATTTPGAVTRAMVLETVNTCAGVLYGDVATAAAGFDAAASAFAVSPTPDNEAAARAAWATAIGFWQQAEVLRLGPAGPTTTPEGEGLRDFVYSWPLVSRCLVEQNIVSQKYAQPTFGQTALINTRGLAAAEYLLFYTGTDNACSSTASINSQGTWAALGQDGLAARKRDYAAVLASDVASKTAAIHAGWTGSFGAELAGAGTSGSPFESEQQALNVISDGLFYVEVEVKDMKLGVPLGKSPDCESATCPQAVESQFAKVARDHVRNNLVGFQRVFDGCDLAADKGIDDMLRGMGQTELADRMSGDLVAAIAAADALPSSDLVSLVQTDTASVDALYAAIKKVTDALKTDLVTVLDLELPKSVEGDND